MTAPATVRVIRSAAESRIAFSAWGAPVEIEVAGPTRLLAGARALVERLALLWDENARDSDLHRVFSLAGTVVTVEPETVALIELAARVAWKRSDASAALHDVIIDIRRDRVGVPDPGLLDVHALIPVLTAALVVRYLTENGAAGARVRIGDSLRAAGSFHPSAHAA